MPSRCALIHEIIFMIVHQRKRSKRSGRWLEREGGGEGEDEEREGEVSKGEDR